MQGAAASHANTVPTSRSPGVGVHTLVSAEAGASATATTQLRKETLVSHVFLDYAAQGRGRQDGGVGAHRDESGRGLSPGLKSHREPKRNTSLQTAGPRLWRVSGPRRGRRRLFPHLERDRRPTFALVTDTSCPVSLGRHPSSLIRLWSETSCAADAPGFYWEEPSSPWTATCSTCPETKASRTGWGTAGGYKQPGRHITQHSPRKSECVSSPGAIISL